MKKRVTWNQVFKEPKYRGKHIVLAAGEVYSTKIGDDVNKLLAKARKDHPKAMPGYAYLLPKNLILTV